MEGKELAKDLLDAVYGCLIGGAIGDALGAPVEGLYYTEIREKYGKITEFLPSYRGNIGSRYGASKGEPGLPGAVTDDTTLRHYMCLAIARKKRRITPDDFAEILLEKMNPDRFWLNEKIMLTKLRIGMNPWDTGKGNPPTGCATMAIAPIGIINAANPAQAYQDAFNIAFINQDDVNRDAAATVAAGIATALDLDATVAKVLESMVKYCSDIVRRAITLTLDIAYDSSTVEEFAVKYYSKMLDWTWPSRTWQKEHFFSGSSIEIVPVAMAILHLCKGDVNQCIIEGANFGRDCDTISSIVGSLAGTIVGASAIRSDWIETCEKANEEFFEELEGDREANFYSMACRLVEALKAESQAAIERVRILDRILGKPHSAES